MRKLLVVVCFLLSVVNAHMWLRNPISQGGVNNIGGTSGPWFEIIKFFYIFIF